MNAPRVRCPSIVGQMLKFQLHRRHHLRVDELPELAFTQKLAKQVAVEGQRRGASLRERGVGLIQICGHKRE